MSLKYKKNSGHGGHDNMWTSYSDLFMGLSFIFLLLYVTASLRSGTTQFQNGAKIQGIVKENEELKSQIRVYESMRKDYLETEASRDENDMYKDLMGQLDLLQDKTKEERLQLTKAANENAQKEKALNKYQQMVKSIIDTNLLAKSKIKKRENVIEEQDVEIDTQNTTIATLNTDIEQRKEELEKGQQRLKTVQAVLNKKALDLKKAFQSQKMSEQKYKLQQAALKRDAEKRMAELRGQNQQIQTQISALDQQLGNAQRAIASKEAELGQAQQTLSAKEQALAAKAREAAGLQSALGQKEAEVGGLKGALGQKEAEVGGLKGALGQKDAEARGLKNALGAAEGKNKDLSGRLSGTEAALAKARAEIEARKKIAREVGEALRKAGVKADVDGGTGDVTIDFGDHFFESGSAMLKPEMRKILEKALPAYARSLMGNKTVGDRLTGLEIVGYASPTYKGRVIDPKSVRPEDKQAIDYNLDLSYKRAKSIFEYVFDPNKMSFDHQQALRPLVKVSGKSFFDSAKGRSIAAATSTKDFCKKNDCKKFQKVLIRFNIDQK